MVAQNDRDRKPSPIDGLTKAERVHLYNPRAWDVESPDGVNFILTNRANGAVMTVVCAFGRFWTVFSNTGGEHHLDHLVCCSCGDKERALKEGRRCKHESAVEGCELYRERQAERRRAMLTEELADRISQDHYVEGEPIELERGARA